MDNIARRAADESPDWIILGLRYFNVYGPREAHKGVPASMVYHLSRQMKAGQRPRIFKHGEQKRDFVYVKDVVEGSIRALDAQGSGIYNLGSGQARSFNELVDVLNKCLGTNFRPITSTIRTRIIKTSPRPISRTRVARLGMSRGFPWKTVCGITCSGCIRQERSLLSFRAQSRNL
jgi:nucleoside-diphosphate-sugar epimerase